MFDCGVIKRLRTSKRVLQNVQLTYHMTNLIHSRIRTKLGYTLIHSLCIKRTLRDFLVLTGHGVVFFQSDIFISIVIADYKDSVPCACVWIE